MEARRFQALRNGLLVLGFRHLEQRAHIGPAPAVRVDGGHGLTANPLATALGRRSRANGWVLWYRGHGPRSSRPRRWAKLPRCSVGSLGVSADTLPS